MYLLDYSFLCSCELEWQVMIEKVVEVAAHMIEDDALVFQLAIFGIAEYVELNVEEFFEFQSEFCTAQMVGRNRVVDIAYSLVE